MKLIHRFFLIAALSMLRDSGFAATLINYVQPDTSKNLQTEKVHLHLDRSHYVAGERIWFKSYVINEARQLSQLSKVLYVDLINPKDQIISTIKLPLAGGMASGDIFLSDTLNTGEYRIRAYTQWMRNFDARYFFNKVIHVDSFRKPDLNTQTQLNIQGNTTSTSDIDNYPDIQFFPESGHLVENIPVKVAFTVTSNGGSDLRVKGYVIDNQNTRVAEFQTQHAGIGDFTITPSPGRVYTAAIQLNGLEIRKTLPIALKDGYILRLDESTEPNSRIRVYNSRIEKIPTTLVVSSSLGVQQIAEVLANKPFVDIIFPKIQLPLGVVKFSLLDSNKKALAERLAFATDSSFNLTLTSQKSTLDNKIALHISAKDKDGKNVTGAFSVAVTEISHSADTLDETNIFNELFLTSELREPIEEPSFYFNNKNELRLKELDNLMLTQKWRQTDPIHIIQDKLYEAEKNIQISGIVSKGNKPLPAASITLLSMEGGLAIDSLTDNSGKFSFSDLIFTGTKRFMLKVNNKRNNADLKIQFDTINHPSVIPMYIYDRSVNDITDLLNSNQNANIVEPSQKIDLSKQQILQEVKVTALKNKRPERSSKLGTQPADYLITQKALEGVQYLDDGLRGKIPGINFWVTPKGEVFAYLLRNQARLNTTIPEFMQVYWDGMPMASNIDLREIALQNIDNIEVLTHSNSTAIYGQQGTGGILLINSKTGSAKNESYSPISTGVGHIEVKGYDVMREFEILSSKAKSPNENISENKTVFWFPNLFTNEKGSTSLEFAVPDKEGLYRIVIEGIDTMGRIARKVCLIPLN